MIFQFMLPKSRCQNSKEMLKSELDIKIKRKLTLFNPEAKWIRRSVYLHLPLGVLLIFVTEKSGYVLKVSKATRLEFEGVKQTCKKRYPDDDSFDYTGSMILHYGFGELHIRFSNDDDLRAWRTITLAAHATDDSEKAFLTKSAAKGESSSGT